MAVNYEKIIVETMSELPTEKQAEVCDFAKFLKSKDGANRVVKKKGKKGTVLSLIGIGKSKSNDVALNHDRYLSE
jgi:hypothetical protein